MTAMGKPVRLKPETAQRRWPTLANLALYHWLQDREPVAAIDHKSEENARLEAIRAVCAERKGKRGWIKYAAWKLGMTASQVRYVATSNGIGNPVRRPRAGVGR
jgi:hypothetical protein